MQAQHEKEIPGYDMRRYIYVRSKADERLAYSAQYWKRERKTKKQNRVAYKKR